MSSKPLNKPKPTELLEILKNKKSNLIQLQERMEKFTKDVFMAICKDDIDSYNEMRLLCSDYKNHGLLVFNVQGVKLVYSCQIINSWCDCFHITDGTTQIHNICKSNNKLIDLHRCSGTASYSFSSNEDFLQSIIDECKNRNF